MASERLSSHRPFANAKKFIYKSVKANAVTNKTSSKPPQFSSGDDPYTDIKTNKAPNVKKVSGNVGGTMPGSKRRMSYAQSTHRQGRKRNG